MEMVYSDSSTESATVPAKSIVFLGVRVLHARSVFPNRAEKRVLCVAHETHFFLHPRAYEMCSASVSGVARMCVSNSALPQVPSVGRPSSDP